MEVLKRFLGLDRMSEVLLAGTVCYLAYAAVFSLYTRWRKKGKIHCRVKLQMEEHRTEVDAFFDTGNSLYDSVLQRPWLVIQLVWQSGWKYLGYLLGKKYRKLPRWVIDRCTMNPKYWE